MTDAGQTDVVASVLSLSARSAEQRDGEYLEWHALDHLPEQYRIAGMRLGARWVSTPACRHARLASAPRFDASDHVVQYLFADPIDTNLSSFFELGKALNDAGRMPLRLPPVELAGYELVGKVAAPEALVGADVVPWRPARGVIVLIEQGDADGFDGVDASGVAGAWIYRGTAQMHPRLAPTDGLTMTVLYVDDDPAVVIRRLSAPLTQRWADGAVEPLLAAPFVTVVPYDWSAAVP